MPYAPEFNESTAKITNTDRAATSDNLMKDVQSYYDEKFPKNLKGDAHCLSGDDAVKKMFNGKEIHKMLSDFVINHDLDQGLEPKKSKP